MIPAVAFVGPSHVGKTTLIERLIPEFAKRNYRVATVKHAGHQVAQDTPLKDSWRFSQAGSDLVVVASDDTTFCVNKGRPIAIDAILRMAEDHADIALVEGFKQSTLPRIEVHRKAVSSELLTPHEALLGIITDEPLDVSVPQFDFADFTGIADLLVRRIVQASRNEVRAVVNGKELFLKPFMQLLIARTTLGMMSAMKGAGEIRTLDLTIRNTTGKWKARCEGWNTDD